MADVSTYRRCTTTYATTLSGADRTFYENEIRPATDPAVAASPSLWVTLTDAVLATAQLEESV
jgi:hypothetical protein